MKYSVMIKFLAVILCAAALLGAVGSAAGILAMVEMGLYEKSYYQAYGEHLHSYAESLAQELATRHAAMSLGGLNAQMADMLQGNPWAYGVYQFQNIGYELRDAEGEVLQSDPLSESVNAVFEKTFTVGGRYPKILGTKTEWERWVQELETLPPEDASAIALLAMPEGDVDIYGITLGYQDGSGEDYGSEREPLGRLNRQENGNYVLICTENMEWLQLNQGSAVEYIQLKDKRGDTVYHAYSRRNAVLQYSLGGDYPWLILSGGMEAVPETSPETVTVREPQDEETALAAPTQAEQTLPATVPPTTTEATTPRAEAAAPETAPESRNSGEADPGTAPTAAAGILQFGYYDHELGQEMVAEYTYEEMPAYTVAVSFGPNALRDESQWQLLGWACVLQKELPLILGVSLLMFAVMAVYLCCAAGRKSGTDAVRAGGLNALPLDLYGVCGFFAEIGLLLAGTEGGVHLLRRNFFVGAAAVGSIAFAACVIFVAFCFACAAQFKMSGGYWWRNSLCGRCLHLSWKACLWLVHKGGPGLLRLFKALWKLVRFFWGLLVKGAAWLLWVISRCFGWLRDKAVKFFSLLPVTWQWLLAGFILIMVLIISMDGFKDGNDVILPLGLLVAFGLVLYGAHCFGILLGSAKRMRKGDLDEKVDDRLLIGSFREFADELNGLADVAVVAARKQLKSERMKTELITNVSHDIKTPLTSIINYVDLLKKAQTQPEREACLEVLDRQSQRLKKLVDDLMEMSKASTGNLAVDIQRVDAAETINQALGEFSDKLEKAGLIPVFRQPEKPIEMMADGRLVWRVMSNLLGNAVKYALPGTRVYVDLAAVEDRVIISMKNISREELNVAAEELLERFVRGDTSRNTDGSGLGLNIAKSLMELQKGQLQLLVDGDLFKVTLIFPGA